MESEQLTAVPPLQTSEAERIGINQVAKVLPPGNDKGTDQRTCCIQDASRHVSLLMHMVLTHAMGDAVTAHFTSLHAALTMLTGRLTLLHGLLRKMAAGAPACTLAHCSSMAWTEWQLEIWKRSSQARSHTTMPLCNRRPVLCGGCLR